MIQATFLAKKKELFFFRGAVKILDEANNKVLPKVFILCLFKRLKVFISIFYEKILEIKQNYRKYFYL